MLENYLWLVPLGFGIGAYATLIGAGGGFILAPILLLLYPAEKSETIASISLAVVFFNALSGSVAYARAKRIDYRSGLVFSSVSVPGAVLGALTTSLIPRGVFDLVFGVLMVLSSAFLLYRPNTGQRIHSNSQRAALSTANHSRSTLIAGACICFSIAYITSLLGIGGGFIEVPTLVYLLKFPVHIATATSQFIVAVVSFSGSATHIATGLFQHGLRRTVALAIGVILGAQLGARLSSQLNSDWIIRSLAAALGFVGLQLFWHVLFS